MNKQFTSHLTVSLDIRNVLEESNDNGENQHETHGEDQWPCEHDAAATQHLLHVEVEAQLHHDGPVHTTQLNPVQIVELLPWDLVLSSKDGLVRTVLLSCSADNLLWASLHGTRLKPRCKYKQLAPCDRG